MAYGAIVFPTVTETTSALVSCLTLTLPTLILPPCPSHRPLWLPRAAFWALSICFLMCHYILQLTTSVSRISHTVNIYEADSAFLMTILRKHSPEHRHQDHLENSYTQNCALYLFMHWCKLLPGFMVICTMMV